MIKFKKLSFTKEQVFISSDFHGYHKNICKGITTWSNKECRNFQNEEEMTTYIINNINKYVSWDSLLIHLGDWTFGGKEKIKKLRDRINCRNIINIQGNHDFFVEEFTSDLFLEFTQIGYYRIENQSIICSHYPLWQWHEQGRDVWNLHGHLHGKEDDILKQIHEYKSFDCGIDNAFKLIGEYKPFSFLEIEEYVKDKKINQRHENI